MNIIELTIKGVENYTSDIIAMLKQSFEKSFPKSNYDIDFYSKRIESLKKYLYEQKAIVYGVEDDRKLAGFIWFFVKDNENNKMIHINHFVVHEDYRGLGIGTSLISGVENYASQKGIDELELFVTKSNEDAVSFYEKRDFNTERLVMKKRVLK